MLETPDPFLSTPQKEGKGFPVPGYRTSWLFDVHQAVNVVLVVVIKCVCVVIQRLSSSLAKWSLLPIKGIPSLYLELYFRE